MPEERTEPVYYVTPPLQRGVTYTLPDLPPLPALWTHPRHATEKPVPTEARCRELWLQYNMMEHIGRHCEQVAAFAAALARRAREINAPDAYGQPDALESVSLAAGLLHDLAKSYTVRYGGSHAQIGASWVLASTGHHRIAQIVLHHVEWPWTLPDNLVHPLFFVMYADKRVTHDQFTTLSQRYDDLLQRYGKTEASRNAILRGREQATTIERVLSTQLEFPLHESIVAGGRLVERA